MSVKGKHRSGEKTTIGNGAKVTAAVTAIVLLATGSFAVTKLVAAGSDDSSNPITASLEGAVVKPASPSKSPSSSEGNTDDYDSDDSTDSSNSSSKSNTNDDKSDKDKSDKSKDSKSSDKDKSDSDKNSPESKDKKNTNRKYSDEDDNKSKNESSNKKTTAQQTPPSQTQSNTSNNASSPTPAPAPQQKPQNNGTNNTSKPSNGNHSTSRPSGGNTNASGAQLHLDWMSPSGEQPDLSGYTEVSLDVDISNETVTVYADGSTVYVMHASTSDHGATPIGTYTVRARGDGYANADGTGYKWWVGPDVYTCLIHSVPVGSDGNWLESEASKLGGKSNIYGVSLSVPDAEWVYNSIPAGSTIVIHK